MPSLTMSMPVTISVTQCSTWTRVFISRKKYSSSCEQALDRAGADVVDGLGGLDRRRADPLAQLLVDVRAGRLLDELLVAALDRAVALAEVDRVAVRVGEDLDLDVARVGQVALEVDGRVAEELLALARGALEGLLELGLVQRDAEALAAAAARGLDGDREADLVLGELHGGLDVRDRLGRAGDDRDAGLLHQVAGVGLRAHRVDRAGRRADERRCPRPRAPWRTWRSRRGSRSRGGRPRRPDSLHDLEDLLDVQVALGGRCGPPSR